MEQGTILDGKYRVDEVLGTGGMGRVVKATHLSLHQPVAIKILLPHMAESTETVQRFVREARATFGLRSEHIARVMDVSTLPDGVPYIVMEYLDGNDLNQILRHHGPQLPSVVCDLMLQACEGMAEAHAKGIVHRDIKPSNFFITIRTDGSMLLKILDFGISKTPIGSTELTGTATVIGTPTYMSPEQMKSGRAADERSDVWSLGVVMYQLLAGRPPWAGESYAELVFKIGGEPPAPMHVQLPAGLNQVILRCLEKDPRYRLQSVAELARMLAPFASDPVAGAQTAARTTRILQQRSSAGTQSSPLIAAGGRLTPVPISPAQLTPRSWPPSGSSLSHGRGQVTHRVRSGRGWLIAGVTALCVAAGAGGYFASRLGDDSEPAAAAPPEPTPSAPDQPLEITTPGPIGTPTETKPVETKPAETKPAETVAKPAEAKPAEAKPAEAKPAEAKPAETKPAAKPVEAKPEAKPAAKPVEAKPEAKPVAKPVATKPTPTTKPRPKPTTKPRPKPTTKPDSDDLFDTRK